MSASKPRSFDGLSYSQVNEKAQTCRNCGLHLTRNKVVFGKGPVPCGLMLIGEGPGADEDVQGFPFVGRAGQLLTKIFESVGIDRENEVYITNTVKCRPPENRTPSNDEIEACHPYLEAQISLIAPKIIVLAGSPACKTMLKSEEPISKIRGKWFKMEGRDTMMMPIFHPSYLLRNQSKEKNAPKWLTWQDMIEIKNAYDCVKKAEQLEAR
ncbi:MAG: uracil-DNA glycosylase [Candidatus Saganbacteria bacterium]|nr:uracil-DNA glycosylase [Candidatus Saganbacteria bacterium]